MFQSCLHGVSERTSELDCLFRALLLNALHIAIVSDAADLEQTTDRLAGIDMQQSGSNEVPVDRGYDTRVLDVGNAPVDEHRFGRVEGGVVGARRTGVEVRADKQFPRRGEGLHRPLPIPRRFQGDVTSMAQTGTASLSTLR